jgi:hypothetical protein
VVFDSSWAMAWMRKDNSHCDMDEQGYGVVLGLASLRGQFARSIDFVLLVAVVEQLSRRFPSSRLTDFGLAVRVVGKISRTIETLSRLELKSVAHVRGHVVEVEWPISTTRRLKQNQLDIVVRMDVRAAAGRKTSLGAN